MSDNKTVKGKVTHVQAAGHYAAKTGRDAGKTKYKFDVILDTEERGQLACLESELNGMDAPIAVGEIHEFNVYPSSNADFPDNWYLRKANGNGAGWKGGSGGSKWTPDPEKENRKERWAKQVVISRQSALNTASSLISAGCGPSTVENLTGIAEQLEKWAYRGLDLKALVNPPATAIDFAAKVAEQKATNSKAPTPAAQVRDMDEVPF